MGEVGQTQHLVSSVVRDAVPDTVTGVQWPDARVGGRAAAGCLDADFWEFSTVYLNHLSDIRMYNDKHYMESWYGVYLRMLSIIAIKKIVKKR